MTNRLSTTALALVLAGAAVADPVDDRLAEYRANGAGPFSADAGELLWRTTYEVDGEARQCADCHGNDLTIAGSHRRTGKTIAPMAPSVNPERLTEGTKVEKWLYRNCKWTLGRPCSPQEKGDVLSWLRTSAPSEVKILDPTHRAFLLTEGGWNGSARPMRSSWTRTWFRVLTLTPNLCSYRSLFWFSLNGLPDRVAA